MVFRAVVIGCGKIGSEFDDPPRVAGIYSHAGAYTHCSRTELVAVCDPNVERLERAAQKWSVSATFRDAQEMLAETKPDLVSICSPDATHYDLIISAINTDGVRAVLAEKPLAIELDQAHEIVNQAERRNVALAVNYMRRYSDAYRELRSCLETGQIGSVRAVSGYYTKGIIHNGSHWIDLARFLIGEIVGVFGMTSQGEVGPDPTIDGCMDFANGARGSLQGCTFNEQVSIFEMDIFGERGRVRIDRSGNEIIFYELKDNPNYGGYKEFHRERQVDGGLSHAMVNAVEDLVDAVTNRKQPRCSGPDAVAALTIACALRDSARQNTPVEF